MISRVFGLMSGTAGLVITVVDLAFAIWAGIGKPWYIYLLNFVILFTASSVINSSYIQGLTRGVSFIYLYGLKGASKAFLINIPTAIFIFIAYFITRFVFSISIQYAMFFGICIVLSTIVAFVDNHFQIAIDRTRAFESVAKRGPREMRWKEINRIKEGIKVDLTEKEVREAIERGTKMKEDPSDSLQLYHFGSVEPYEDHGHIHTKFFDLVVLGYTSAHTDMGYKNLETQDIVTIVRMEHLGISIVTYGDKKGFAKNYRIMLKQGNKLIQPDIFEGDMEIETLADSQESPSFEAMLLAYFPYSEIDLKAKTTIILIKDEGESRFEVDFFMWK